MVVISNIKNMTWCTFNPKHEIKDPHYGEILNFYLWKCPAENTAFGSKTFKELGWEGGYQFKALKKTILNPSLVPIPFVCVGESEFIENLKFYKQFQSYSFEEVSVFIKTGEGEMTSLFRYIRNSFAHGSFMVRKNRSSSDYFYFLESRNPQDKLRARIVLKSSTLFSALKIVNSGYDSIKSH